MGFVVVVTFFPRLKHKMPRAPCLCILYLAVQRLLVIMMINQFLRRGACIRDDFIPIKIYCVSFQTFWMFCKCFKREYEHLIPLGLRLQYDFNTSRTYPAAS